jgi:hypothetical protein
MEIFQVLRHRVCAHSVPLNDVASVFCVPSHSTGSVSLVKTTTDILSSELEVAVATDAEGLRGPHDSAVRLAVDRPFGTSFNRSAGVSP